MMIHLGKNQNTYDSRRGQVIILATLALGGAILGATTIAGLLMIYQIRQTVDVRDSAAAIFASDAGVEWGQFQFYHSLIAASTTPPVTPFANGTTFELHCFGIDFNTNKVYELFDVDGNPDCSDINNVQYIRSIGKAGVSRTVVRALEISFAP